MSDKKVIFPPDMSGDLPARGSLADFCGRVMKNSFLGKCDDDHICEEIKVLLECFGPSETADLILEHEDSAEVLRVLLSNLPEFSWR